ncbi:hypothetical protein OS493_014261 [Desmophyllum pertusum]|uniref:Uncharacterized protein n=1 Tax=Desmophyllum pertusum TaxID=174260 RepID=A0A9W9Z0L5_9CNID|nr:hypothetical protein OS493_014261 [Desmophyllum pertusum]
MAFGNIATERLVKEKPEHELRREGFQGCFRAYERGIPVNYNEMTRNVSDNTMAANLETHLPRREHSQRVDSYGEMMNSFVKSEMERTERRLQHVSVRLRENLESLDDSKGNLHALISHEKLSPPGQLDSESEFEDDFNTKPDDGNGKSTPIKRGPGRPRKRKYFGAGSRGDKTSPIPTDGYNKEDEESLPVSEAHSPEMNAVASESESVVSKESEPPKKKKKRAKQKSSVEREARDVVFINVLMDSTLRFVDDGGGYTVIQMPVRHSLSLMMMVGTLRF